MRPLLHGLFALAVLLGGIGAAPTATGPVPHQDCCCGDEAACPCEPARAPEGPRRPCGGGQATPAAALPAAARPATAACPRTEPRPWSGLAAFDGTFGPARPADPADPGQPRGKPRPPGRSLERLASLSTFRI